MNVLFTLLFNPVILALAVGLGIAVCRLFGADPHVRELLIAATVCLISVEAGVMPLVRRKVGDPGALFQAGFAGTLLHLVLAAGLAATVMFGWKAGNAFAYWLLALYWVTLLGLCLVIVKRLRASERGAATTTTMDGHV